MSYRQVAYAYSTAPAYAKQSRSRRASPQNVVGASALSFVALASLGMLATNILGDKSAPAASDTGAEIITIAQPRSLDARGAISSLFSVSSSLSGPRVTFEVPALAKGDRLDIADRQLARSEQSAKGDKLAVHVIDQAPQQVASLETPPQDIQPSSPPPTQLANAEPSQTVQVLANIPLPPPRPVIAAPQTKVPSAREIAQANKPAVLANATPSQKPNKVLSIFEKLFGKRDEPKGTQLAYASPDGGVTGSLPTNPGNITAAMTPPFDRQTAVYDITARTVYLPDGTRLEAHSGLGSRLDDPRSMRERMRGVTPPHVYDLKLRESLFHGVEAIRLTPVGGEDAIFGRNGLLAHTYMLGPNGDSNGCVSFRDYNRFLQAYKKGDVKRLVVVAKVD
ncbi:MAG TPA: tlde1 domain-containing protein [Afipia sp.]